MVRVKSKNVKSVSPMFNDEKLRGIMGFRIGMDYIEVTCGCTSRKYGDAVGKLRVFNSGKFLIICECNAEHTEDMMAPAVFEKHSLRLPPRNWKENIWVIYETADQRPKSRKIRGEEKTKFPLRQTGLLKYYKHIANMPNNEAITHRRWQFHRDEFIRCTFCEKLRRFRLHTEKEFRIYHDAVSSTGWKCCDRPYDKISCGNEEERESRKIYRGCPRKSACKGCTSCVCFGCLKCRLSDCTCRTCRHFMNSAAKV